jgi:hypothetical protein
MDRPRVYYDAVFEAREEISPCPSSLFKGVPLFQIAIPIPAVPVAGRRRRSRVPPQDLLHLQNK